MDHEDDIVLPIGKKTALMISAICLIAMLTLLAISSYAKASIRPEKIILPGGVTYLGPNSK
jgi:hypothetical protein